MGALFPFFRPALGIGLTQGADELDVAAAFDVYSGTSSATHAILIAAAPTITTRHGVVLLAHKADASAPRVDRRVIPGVSGDAEVENWAATRGLAVERPHAAMAPGEFSYDPLLRDLAAHADRATARATAKFTEYPRQQVAPRGAWPWCPTLLVLLAIVVSAVVSAVARPGALSRDLSGDLSGQKAGAGRRRQRAAAAHRRLGSRQLGFYSTPPGRRVRASWALCGTRESSCFAIP